MKKKSLLVLGMLVIAFSFVVVGCATISSVGGTVDTHGLFSNAGKVVSSGGDVIASYGIILNLVDTGYEGYVATVREAENAGKLVATVTTRYLWFYTKITAYAR
jgi:hypothetical protein